MSLMDKSISNKFSYLSLKEKGRLISSIVNLSFAFLFIILGILNIFLHRHFLPKIPEEGGFLFFIANFLLITGLITEILGKAILKSFSWWNFGKIIIGIVLLEIWIYIFALN